MIYHGAEWQTSRIVGSRLGMLLGSLAILFMAMPLLGASPDLQLGKSDAGVSSSGGGAGGFELIGQIENPAMGDAKGGGYSLRTGCSDGASSAGPGCPSCLCEDILFADGFESGDTGAWQ